MYNHVSEIIYIPSFNINSPIMWTKPNLFTKFFCLNGLKWKILVYPFAFSKIIHSSLDEFLGTLIYHEVFHAKENY